MSTSENLADLIWRGVSQETRDGLSAIVDGLNPDNDGVDDYLAELELSRKKEQRVKAWATSTAGDSTLIAAAEGLVSALKKYEAHRDEDSRRHEAERKAGRTPRVSFVGLALSGRVHEALDKLRAVCIRDDIRLYNDLPGGGR